jgi:hypothetical protein
MPGRVMGAAMELTTERIIVSGAALVLTAAILWTGARLQDLMLGQAEMRVEIRQLVGQRASDETKTLQALADVERRLRALEAQQRAERSR